jgi:autocrine motility factor receptor
LRSWLEQDTSCPKCRKSLQDEKENQQQATTRQPGQPIDPQEPQQPQQQPPQVQRIVHRNLFQFNGSRYISWLPNFSLQVTNGTNVVLPGLLRSRATLEPERLNEMVSIHFILSHKFCIKITSSKLNQMLEKLAN